MTDQDFMDEALAEAELAKREGEYPVGAVIVREGEILSRGHNAQTTSSDPTAHAEVVAIRAACEKLGARKLAGCTLYTTLAPCPMCEGAILEADFERVVFGGSLPLYVRDLKFDRSKINLIGPIDERGRALFEERLRDDGRDEVFQYERSAGKRPL